MSDFPNSLDALDDKEDAVDYPQAADINNLNDAIEKVEAKVGIDSSAVASSLDYIIKNTTSGHKHDGVTSRKVLASDLNGFLDEDNMVSNSATSVSSQQSIKAYVDSGTVTMTNKTLTSPVLNTGISGTAFLDEDNMASNSATKVASQQSIKAYVDASTPSMSAAWPIGSVFISVVSTNPATLLGFGTWTAFGAGKVLVGLNASDADFDTAEETGGAKTVTIAQANLPNISTGAGSAHTHTQDAHTHTIAIDNTGTTSSGSTGMKTGGSTSTESAIATNQNESAHTHSLGGSGTAMSVMNPYIIVRFWKRTA